MLDTKHFNVVARLLYFSQPCRPTSSHLITLSAPANAASLVNLASSRRPNWEDRVGVRSREFYGKCLRNSAQGWYRIVAPPIPATFYPDDLVKQSVSLTRYRSSSKLDSSPQCSPGNAYSRSLSQDRNPPSTVDSHITNRETFAQVMVDEVTKALYDIWPISAQDPFHIHSLQCKLSVDGDDESVHSECRSIKYQASPLRTFVHDILRRSKTTGWTLQAASCYIEAVRPKVALLIRTGANAISSEPLPLRGEDTSEGPKEPNATLASKLLSESTNSGDSRGRLGEDTPTHSKRSPLLCPQLTFLAALCLASKFMQDRCCSNRFWANLSGLSVKEVGRCERALAEALDCRLWVGKGFKASSSKAVE
ncbi:hypothetical protein NMY22_g11432 [Coprinellus aureogranulatus]|nr:hypothetical protein NMY22_g11432 [Coprinellus aureogranulatus]